MINHQFGDGKHTIYLWWFGDDLTYWFTHINPQDRTVGNLDTFKYHWTNLRETRFVIFLGMASNHQKMQKTICLTILE